ncbi:Wzz/FepE/Etk N-terminal domain-containing protein [Roseateles asaccharophilus]|uniref:Uncharacterized protein involved in exopolysaccharide biosynthesis n=1 Tax=Roseateles asaccharophilus TaxID=582607 RepID=A0ABU2AC14_9BURK|nr:Wzz/FepE/Etk N-terminal domain-containing protein [Roseateles asaccharophilus]MDR7334739.1 uncharacterized protein involved in exopolysaccharide biosynthesis [Roseateles asaccharophilus]
MMTEQSLAAEPTLGDYLQAVLARWKLVVAAPLGASLLALGASYLIKPTFTASTSFLPPQQQQPGAAAGALASLGALAGLSGAMRSSGDQYAFFVKSRTVAERMVDRFDLKTVYDEELRFDARRQLGASTRVTLGKKDGVITVEVDDQDPKRAADMAAAYVDEVRKLTANLTLTEAQQRRTFFEGQLKQVRTQLDAAQSAMQGSGLSTSIIKAEPKAAVEALAKMRAELTAGEVRLQVLRNAFADSAPEIQQQLAAIGRLRAEIARSGEAEPPTSGGGYVAAYRDFKYQEALFELIARQYELARIDESRDGGQLQVIDAALVPERKSKPKRSHFMMIAFAATAVAVILYIGIGLNRSRTKATA